MVIRHAREAKHGHTNSRLYTQATIQLASHTVRQMDNQLANQPTNQPANLIHPARRPCKQIAKRAASMIHRQTQSTTKRLTDNIALPRSTIATREKLQYRQYATLRAF